MPALDAGDVADHLSIGINGVEEDKRTHLVVRVKQKPLSNIRFFLQHDGTVDEPNFFLLDGASFAPRFRYGFYLLRRHFVKGGFTNLKIVIANPVVGIPQPFFVFALEIVVGQIESRINTDFVDSKAEFCQVRSGRIRDMNERRFPVFFDESFE